MKGYIVGQIEVHDPKAYKEYRDKAPAVIAQFGGRYLIRGGAVEALEGELRRSRVVVLEFPSPAQARAFYESPEYKAILPLRTSASGADLLLVEGYDG